MNRAKPTPLPPLTAVRTRDAKALGLSEPRLRGPAHRRVSHGLYAGAADEHGLVDLARITIPLLPSDAGFGHLTSAALRGWWLPNQLPAQLPILFASTRSGVHRQRHGLYVRRSRYTHVEDLDGIPVVTAAETLIELANDLSLVDLVPRPTCISLGPRAIPNATAATTEPRRGTSKTWRATRPSTGLGSTATATRHLRSLGSRR